MLGRVASALLGKQVDYRVNPETGQQEAYEVPQRPGDLFRHILAGALIGGAAAKGTNSVLAGFSRGGAAGIEANRDADQQRQQRAQQDFKNRQEKSKTDAEIDAHHAQMQLANVQTLIHESDSSLKTAAELDRHNASDRMRREHAEENGGVKYPVEGNGVQGKGADLAAAYNAGKISAPAGHMLQFTTEYDHTGLHHDINKGRWVDDETGEPVNMATRTTYHLQSVPLDSMKKLSTYTGAEIQKAFPGQFGNTLKPDQEYNLNGNTIQGLHQKETAEQNKKHADELKDKREKRLTSNAARDQARKDEDEKRKKALADLKLKGGNQSKLQFLHVNPDTKQSVGWNGSAWVDSATGKPVAGQ